MAIWSSFCLRLAIGAIYGLIAMGFAVIYKSTGLVNFAARRDDHDGSLCRMDHFDRRSAAMSSWSRLAPFYLPFCSASSSSASSCGRCWRAGVRHRDVTIGLAVILRSSIGFIWTPTPMGLIWHRPRHRPRRRYRVRTAR